MMEGEILVLRYSKRKRSDEVRLEAGGDQKKKRLWDMKRDLVWRVFVPFPTEAEHRRLSARPLHYL